MPLTNVLSVDISTSKRRRYAELCHELAETAKNTHHPFQWTAHETRVGKGNRIHFATTADDFAAFEALGTPDEMILRVLGEKRALEWMDETDACVQGQQQSTSVDRPDLSYIRTTSERTSPFAIVTTVRARPGHEDACEELIRKIAEAIPKANDGNEILTFQTVIGDLSSYWTARPLDSMAKMDAVMAPGQLLNEAFGNAEGGLIFRTGLEAVSFAERSLVAYRPELSNVE